jgi:hypothetical protein
MTQHPITSNNIPMDTKKISRMTPPDGPTVSRLPLEDLEDLGLPLKAPVIHSWLHSVGKPMITPWFKFIYYLCMFLSLLPQLVHVCLFDASMIPSRKCEPSNDYRNCKNKSQKMSETKCLCSQDTLALGCAPHSKH